ncbi:hypothetical protein [Sulfobacillus thermosulfidooxidans]|uniref:hypothetical protein n=1 Tax=Sulfobacillus thermosulfidooxidans TaxID=28034 RepID=UPI0002D6D842|nr:hypothetical protein [Sulfobacillus thermosulfidooxidans]
MSWIITQLGNLGSLIFSAFLRVFGYIVGQIAHAILSLLVLPLLRATIFQPFSLSSHTVVGRVAISVWETMGGVSAGVALLLFLWGVLSRMAGSIGGHKSYGELAEGGLVYLAVIVAGWGFLNLLLHISNVGTAALVAGLNQTVGHVFATQTAPGVVSGAGAVFTYLLWPLSGLAMLALVLWAVGVWFMRQVDLVLYASLLPLTAALGLSGNKTPFKWAWSEAMGAVFNQLAMAFIFWMGFQFVGDVQVAPLRYGGQNLHGIVQQFVALGLTLTTLTLAARAPQILAHLTGHQSAGAGHLLTGMALGYLGGRGVAMAMRGTPAGQAVKSALEGREHRAAAMASDWAGRSTVGQKFGQSRVGHAVSHASQRIAGMARNAVGSTAVGQAAQAWSAQHPHLVAGARKSVQAALRPVRTASSFLYQPMATLGSMQARGVVDSHPDGPSGLLALSQAATIYTAQHGVEAAANHFFGSDAPPPPGLDADAIMQDRVAQLGQLMNAQITPHGPDYQIQFLAGAPQKALFDRTQHSVLQNIPSVPSGHPTYMMGGSGRSSAAAR